MGHGGGTPGDGERPDMSDENSGQMPGSGERPDMPDGDGGQMPENGDRVGWQCWNTATDRLILEVSSIIKLIIEKFRM